MRHQLKLEGHCGGSRALAIQQWKKSRMSAPALLCARRTIDTWVRSGLPPARSIFSLADFQRWYTPAPTTAKMNYPAVCAAYNKANLIYFKRRRAPAKATTCLSYKHVNSVHVLLLVQRRRKIITLSGTRRCSRFAARRKVWKVSALGRFGFFIIIDTEKCMRLQFSHTGGIHLTDCVSARRWEGILMRKIAESCCVQAEWQPD